MMLQSPATIFQRWQQVVSIALPYLICVALLVFPLSIAICNIILGFSLFLSITSGAWLKGLKSLFQASPLFSKILIAYLTLIPIGLLWSPDISRGLVILSKQWSWLLLPLILITAHEVRWRNRLLMFLSIGLGLHLLLSISQAFGIPLPVQAPGGSGEGDPGGLIGHISFGFLYGIWGTWLIQWGLQRQNTWRYLAWALATMSIIMVFVVQGRSGYLVTIAVLALMAWKLCLHKMNWRLLLTATVMFAGVMIMIATGPARERLQWTTDSIQAIYSGDFSKAEARWSLWYAAWEGWKQNPLLGVGTGGFPSTADSITAAKPDLYFGGTSPAHPHQMYLLDLVRWGPVGLLMLLSLLWQWLKLGKDSDWRKNHTDSLITMAALGLAVHGLSAPSLEEYHSSVFATILLGLGLAALKARLEQA